MSAVRSGGARLLPSTAMAGLGACLSVASAASSHSPDGWIRGTRRWGGTHGDARAWTGSSQTGEWDRDGAASLTLRGRSSSGTPGRVRRKRLPLNLRPPPPPPPLGPPPLPLPRPPPPLSHLTAWRQKVITRWKLPDPDRIIKPTLETVSSWFDLHPFVDETIFYIPK